ncbi:hypothetical protein [Deinococcus radiophilus]|uniref:Uncharacterized protein n=1 Tax=Deinococcus radiophilus TaxID=32062 RepID=A0A431W1U8_9DEIO|nr:hypothetical protein [Deinococcus radiophilus]RTR29460.1 hypothetical protein EJ104_03480 [Deinococcus radiophilus]UFA50705.1 hypothetical protein LMT64_02020 [Deinococcus radiophilus]
MRPRLTPLNADAPHLLAVMLLTGLAGTALRLLSDPGETLPTLLLTGLYLSLPLLAAAGLTVSQPRRGVCWGAGLGAALAAAYCNYVLMDPQYNQDANIGLGLYLLGGFVLVLGPAALLGGALGYLFGPQEQSEPATSYLPLWPWLKPLGLPVLGAVAAAGVDYARTAALTGLALADLLIGAAFLAGSALLYGLLLSLLPLLWLRGLAARTGQPRHPLAAFWGICAGLALGGVLVRAWPSMLAWPLAALLPLLGGVLGWQTARPTR